MNNNELLTEINKIEPNIQKLAFVFIKKMRQPSFHSIEDLISEGKWAAIVQLKVGRPDPRKGASVSTYLIQTVVRHFINLVRKSYKMDFDPTIAQNRKLDRIQKELPPHISKIPESSKVEVVLSLLDSLEEKEKMYVALTLSPPDSIRSKVRQDKGSKKGKSAFRKYIREELDISLHEEANIRRKIQQFLLEVKNVSK